MFAGEPVGFDTGCARLQERQALDEPMRLAAERSERGTCRQRLEQYRAARARCRDDEHRPRQIRARDPSQVRVRQRTRWLGLEQEGFGIVFLEAAAAGVPQIADGGGPVMSADEFITELAQRAGLSADDLT